MMIFRRLDNLIRFVSSSCFFRELLAWFLAHFSNDLNFGTMGVSSRSGSGWFRMEELEMRNKYLTIQYAKHLAKQY